jgi:hypothetical protein
MRRGEDMGKMTVVLFILFFMLALSGCSLRPASSESPAPPKASVKAQAVDYSSVRLIQLASDKAVLIDGTSYEITPASTFTSASGTLLEPEELNPGDLVFLTASKKTTGPSPGKGILLSLTKQDDKMSRTISKAVGHVLENQTVGDIIAPEVKSVSSHLVTLQFKDLANTHKYECIVNINSLKFHVREIPAPA